MSKTTTPKRGSAVESNMSKPWKPKKEGEEISGIYRGFEIVDGKGKREPFPSYHIQLAGDLQLNDANKTVIPAGEKVRVASAMLKTKLNQVPRGTFIWLKFVGMFKTDNGDSPDYEVTLEEGAELIDPLAETE